MCEGLVLLLWGFIGLISGIVYVKNEYPELFKMGIGDVLFVDVVWVIFVLISCIGLGPLVPIGWCIRKILSRRED
jgi:hypothetical protein